MSEGKVILKNVRLAFEQIFEAKSFKGQGTPNFSATFLMEPDSENKKKIDEAIKAVAKEAWKDKAAATLKSIKNNPNKMCFMDGDTKSQYEGFEGMWYITAKNRSRPDVRDRDGTTPLTSADGVIYSGCYVNAILQVWAQSGDYTGIRCQLSGVQFVRDGDAFGGGTKASDSDFEDLTDGADATEDPSEDGLEDLV